MEVPEVTWQDFLDSFAWKQGEHVTMIGPTGQGKTTLVRKLLPMRDYVIVFGTKAKDSELDKFVKEDGFQKFRTFAPHSDATPRYLFQPQPRGSLDDFRHMQRQEFDKALTYLFKNPGWALYLDEVAYLSRNLKLGESLSMLWLQGRSNHTSMVCSTQKPFHIPMEAYDQATHLFFWRQTDAYNLRRLSELGGMDSGILREVIPTLEQFQFVYYNTRTGKAVRSKVEL